MANAGAIQDQARIEEPHFSKLKIIASILAIIAGLMSAIFYLKEFYSIRFDNLTGENFAGLAKTKWIHQIPLRYSCYCLAIGIISLIGAFLALAGLVKRRESYYDAAWCILIFFQLARAVLE